MHVTFIFDDQILSHQPLGAAYISSMLKEAGHRITTVNLDRFSDYTEIIKHLSPDILAFSCATSRSRYYFDINRKIKEVHPCFTIFGGPHPTFFPQTIEEEGVDAICSGEGEYPMLELVNAMDAGRDYTDIANLSFRIDGETIKNSNRPFLVKDELNALPFPDRELIRGEAIWSHRTGYVMAGRGCPYDCSYCFNHISRTIQTGRWTRQRSVDNVLAEIRWLKEKYHIIYVAFQDDTFILNRRWLREFLPRYGQEIGLPFICNVRCDLTDEEEARLLAEAGCIRVATGIENGNDELRQTILAKNVTSEQIRKACDLYNQHGIKIVGQNMFGVPGETVETALSTVELNLRCRTHTNTFSFFAPFPGTKLGEICQKEYGFSGNLEEIPQEFQDCLTPSIQLDNRELIEKIGQCAHLFMSYPRVFWITKKILRWLPIHSLKLMLMGWLVRITRELVKKGTVGLPSVWHQPKFIIESSQSPQPDIPEQPVTREKKAEAA